MHPCQQIGHYQTVRLHAYAVLDVCMPEGQRGVAWPRQGLWQAPRGGRGGGI